MATPALHPERRRDFHHLRGRYRRRRAAGRAGRDAAVEQQRFVGLDMSRAEAAVCVVDAAGAGDAGALPAVPRTGGAGRGGGEAVRGLGRRRLRPRRSVGRMTAAHPPLPSLPLRRRNARTSTRASPTPSRPRSRAAWPWGGTGACRGAAAAPAPPRRCRSTWRAALPAAEATPSPSGRRRRRAATRPGSGAHQWPALHRRPFWGHDTEVSSGKRKQLACSYSL